ncbi:hypothetical protein CHU98_g7333 [Xylaria longipes]|nr:hypothetical protein CHU98_g7333 [Xylaria longipes]
MAPRSSRHHSRYDDPYTFDDPYIHSPPTAHNQPAYEYVGTDEPLSPRFTSPPRHTFSPDYDRARRNARTTSPPRHSRHEKADTPPYASRQRHSSSQRPKDQHLEKARDGRKQSKGKHFYTDFADNNPKLQQYGKQGLSFLGEAAAAYAAAKAGKDAAKDAGDGPRSRSVDHSDRHGRPSRHSSSRHHRRHASSPSRSPSPPPRRHSPRHTDREYNRRRRYSPSPPPLSRDPDSYLASRHGSDRPGTVNAAVTGNFAIATLHHQVPRHPAALALVTARRRQLIPRPIDGRWRRARRWKRAG